MAAKLVENLDGCSFTPTFEETPQSISIDLNQTNTTIPIVLSTDGKTEIPIAFEEQTQSIPIEFNATAEQIPILFGEACPGTVNSILINETQSVPIKDNTAYFPLANGTLLGFVQSSEEINKIAIETDGTMEINSVNISKLHQYDGQLLILDNGDSNKEE